MLLKNNIRDFLDIYDAFILDIWGVLHDGIACYDGVLDSLKEMKRLNKKIVLLSNAPSRSKLSEEKLKEFGIERNFYDEIITSGETAYEHLKENQETGFKKYGKNFYHLGSLHQNSNLLEDLEYNEMDTKNLEKSDFVIVTGYHTNVKDELSEMNEIEICAKNNIPFICVNPDKSFIRSDGYEYRCAGNIADIYKQMGGKNLIYFGKPYPDVYQIAFSKLGITDKKAILAIGDGHYTDILGANNQEIDSALICGGMLSKELKITHGQLPAKNQIEKICKEHNIEPTYILSALKL
jgi:HAD superfamily hydrolase (TIGR01459 family)